MKEVLAKQQKAEIESTLDEIINFSAREKGEGGQEIPWAQHVIEYVFLRQPADEKTLEERKWAFFDELIKKDIAHGDKVDLDFSNLDLSGWTINFGESFKGGQGWLIYGNRYSLQWDCQQKIINIKLPFHYFVRVGVIDFTDSNLNGSIIKNEDLRAWYGLSYRFHNTDLQNSKLDINLGFTKGKNFHRSSAKNDFLYANLKNSEITMVEFPRGSYGLPVTLPEETKNSNWEKVKFIERRSQQEILVIEPFILPVIKYDEEKGFFSRQQLVLVQPLESPTEDLSSDFSLMASIQESLNASLQQSKLSLFQPLENKEKLDSDYEIIDQKSSRPEKKDLEVLTEQLAQQLSTRREITVEAALPSCPSSGGEIPPLIIDSGFSLRGAGEEQKDLSHNSTKKIGVLGASSLESAKKDLPSDSPLAAQTQEPLNALRQQLILPLSQPLENEEELDGDYEIIDQISPKSGKKDLEVLTKQPDQQLSTRREITVKALPSSPSSGGDIPPLIMDPGFSLRGAGEKQKDLSHNFTKKIGVLNTSSFFSVSAGSAFVGLAETETWMQGSINALAGLKEGSVLGIALDATAFGLVLLTLFYYIQAKRPTQQDFQSNQQDTRVSISSNERKLTISPHVDCEG